jgi:heat shock protein HslJ
MRSLRFALGGLALVGAIALAACGSDDDGVGDTTTTTAPATTAASTTAASTTTVAGATTTAAAQTTALTTTTALRAATTTPRPPGTGTTPASGALELEGVTWTLSDKTDLGVPLGDVDVTARFLAGQVGGTSGCNQYRGTYVRNGDQLTIQPNVASTLIACPAPQSAVEAAYLKVLPTVATYAINDTTLTLSNAAGKVVLVYDHIAGEQILAGDWEVTALRIPNAISSPVPGSTLTMSFKDGQVSGSSGCNTYSGSYTVNGDQLTFGPMATTRKACADQAVSDQETAFLAALEATASFSGTKSAVTLLAADGTITFNLARA